MVGGGCCGPSWISWIYGCGGGCMLDPCGRLVLEVAHRSFAGACSHSMVLVKNVMGTEI
jgi:hypothetical protein